MLRKTLFWFHLVIGLVAGVIIFWKCATGLVLTLEKPVIAWVDREVRQMAAPPAAGASRLTLEELVQRVRQARPEARPSAVSLEAEPTATVLVRLGREEFVYVHPFTGEVLAPRSGAAQKTFRTVVEWHRWFGLNGDARTAGKQVGGAANVVFLLLAVTGLYLWWPRHWSWRGVRAIAVLNLRLAGKARDFNWHNSIGLWCTPALIVITATALPISYRTVSDWIPRLTGEAAERPRGGGEAGGAERSERRGERGNERGGERREGQAANRSAGGERSPAQPDLDRMFALAAQAVPQWEAMTLRLSAAGGRDGGGSGPGGRGGANGNGRSAQVKESGAWPRTASVTLNFDATTGAISSRDTFGQQSLARQIRGWTRFLHTGEALGWVGQTVAGLACLGGIFLVYTGFALSWRRFFRRKHG